MGLDELRDGVGAFVLKKCVSAGMDSRQRLGFLPLGGGRARGGGLGLRGGGCGGSTAFGVIVFASIGRGRAVQWY